MNKNKKKLLVILTVFVSMMIFTNKVDAIIMYKQCTYDSICTQNGPGWCVNEMWGDSGKNFCLPELNTYVSVTDNKGNVEYKVKHSEENGLYELEDEYGGEGCWLREINGSCKKESDRYSSSPMDLFHNNSCPSGITMQRGFQWSRIAELGACVGSFGAGAIGTLIGLTSLCKDSLCSWETWQNWEFVPFGTKGNLAEISSIDKTEYVFYSFDLNGKTIVLGEGYSQNGEYSYVGPNYYNFLSDEITNYQLKQISKLKGDFWKVHENFESRVIASDKSGSIFINNGGVNVCNDGEEACKRDYNYKLLYTSSNVNLLLPDVKEWYVDNQKNFESLNHITELVNKDVFVNASTDLNEKMKDGKVIDFNKYNYNGKKYDQESLITDLESAYQALVEAYPESDDEYGFLDYGYLEEGKTIFTSAPTSLTSYIMTHKLGIVQIRDLQFDEKASEYSLNPGFLVSGLRRDASAALEKYASEDFGNINTLKVSDSLDEYTKLFYMTVAYLNSSPANFHLTTEQSARIEILMEKFRELIDRVGIDFYPVVDCKSLLSEDLINKINSYVNIIKIIVPIIVIGFGIMEFTKAIFAGTEEDMKKIQKKFLKRLVIAILIFLTPIFVNLLLQLANKVWLTISPNSCGIFQ